MNRIILIGNGFDLAHGLKTRYSDFINWYWEQRIKELKQTIKDTSEDDNFCILSINNNIDPIYRNWMQQSSFILKNFPQIDGISFFSYIKNNQCFRINFRSQLFEEIHKSIETKNWVDIEEIFYKQLTQGSRSNIKRVNDELENIKNKLIEYLLEIQKSISKDIIRPDITAKILEEVQEKDIAIKSKNNNPYLKQTLSDILLLNFNYTSVADMYLPTPNRFQPKTDKFSLIHIHGKLEEPQNIIFGYGNEDERFKNILNRNDNEYLKHIKSIRYSETDNYRKLLQFIESGYYQVYIMGHSCGPSDGTLLNTLFEHKYCVGIKPFYHKKADGTDNYMEITQNILRNFTDMQLMRDRVVNKTYCECLNQ